MKTDIRKPYFTVITTQLRTVDSLRSLCSASVTTVIMMVTIFITTTVIIMIITTNINYRNYNKHHNITTVIVGIIITIEVNITPGL
jgi:predicted ferric reductase